MEKGALIILGFVKISLGAGMLYLGNGFGAITILLGIVWIVIAIVQYPSNSKKKISDIKPNQKLGLKRSMDTQIEEVY